MKREYILLYGMPSLRTTIGVSEQQDDQTHHHLFSMSSWACLSMMMTFLTQVHSRIMGTSLVISSGLHIRQRTCTSRLPCCMPLPHLR